MTLRKKINIYDYPLTPFSLSQRERGEKSLNVLLSPLSCKERGLGGEVKFAEFPDKDFL